MSDVVKSLNGTVWVFAALLIGMVVIQALLFLRLALNFNKKNSLLTKDEISSAARTGAVSVLGPAVSVTVVALSLIAMVGSGVTFMRCGVIGAPGWELMMANTSAAAVGVTFGTPEFTANVFVLCIFGMTLASAPYFINTIITLKPLDLAVSKSAAKGNEGKPSFIPVLGKAAMMGVMGYSLLDYITNFNYLVALVTSSVVAYSLMRLAAKTGVKWLNDFNMAFAMVIGMAVAQIVTTL